MIRSGALLLFGLAVASALPQPIEPERINWPADAPSWWPDRLPWPPALPDAWPDRPDWWPDSLPWPPARPDAWPDRPTWWPDSLPWPPARPDAWPDRPTWWPDSLPWPPARPDAWPDRPTWWPESLPWPPAIPDAWPDRPTWWPDSLPWPPARPDAWPDRPDWWPESLPWPPAIPDAWPDRPTWWPESLPWPPAIPDAWPDRPEWLPDNLPWPPALPEITWPPEGIDTDRIPYIPSRDNVFHLFTRLNPGVSQPIVFENNGVLQATNYRADRRTVVVMHDYEASATAPSNAVLIPAFLAAADVNVIAVDWSAGAFERPTLSTFYSVLSGNFVARFLNWISESSPGGLSDFHLVGLGLGAWNVGVISLRTRRQVGYITALDPSKGSTITDLVPALRLRVAQYSEVIHTDTDGSGYRAPLGDVDFYPNGGRNQPGCGNDSTCNRNRAVYFLAESVQTGGFTGRRCDNWRDVFEGGCTGDALNLGGLEPKTGSRGVYHLTTNAVPPFSQG